MLLFSRLYHILYCIYRYRDSARLTVTNLASNYSRTYEGPQRIFSDVEMKFNANSSVFFGGLPSNEKVRTLVYRSLDNEIIGGIKFLSTSSSGYLLRVRFS